MIRELVGIAGEVGIKRLYFSADAVEEKDAIASASHLGFHKIAILPSYSRGIDGNYRDVILMDLEIGALKAAGPHLY